MTALKTIMREIGEPKEVTVGFQVMAEKRGKDDNVTSAAISRIYHVRSAADAFMELAKKNQPDRTLWVTHVKKMMV